LPDRKARLWDKVSRAFHRSLPGGRDQVNMIEIKFDAKGGLLLG
jgi:hypothetical protein